MSLCNTMLGTQNWWSSGGLLQGRPDEGTQRRSYDRLATCSFWRRASRGGRAYRSALDCWDSVFDQRRTRSLEPEPRPRAIILALSARLDRSRRSGPVAGKGIGNTPCGSNKAPRTGYEWLERRFSRTDAAPEPSLGGTSASAEDQCAAQSRRGPALGSVKW